MRCTRMPRMPRMPQNVAGPPGNALSIARPTMENSCAAQCSNATFFPQDPTLHLSPARPPLSFAGTSMMCRPCQLPVQCAPILPLQPATQHANTTPCRNDVNTVRRECKDGDEEVPTRSLQSAQVLLSGILDSAFMRSLQSAILFIFFSLFQ